MLRTAPTSIRVTRVAAPGAVSTSPSSARRCSASRTGVRLTPSDCATSRSRIWWPGGKSALTIAFSTISYTWSRSEARCNGRRGRLTAIGVMQHIAYPMASLGAPQVVRMSVNGAPAEGLVEARTTLADFLREDLDLTGTHI